MSTAHSNYYLPNPSPWPIITSAGLFSLALGTVLTINGIQAGPWLMALGAAVIVFMMVRWFGQVIGESESGTYNAQVDRSFRWGMAWFILSEVMFFAAFLARCSTSVISPYSGSALTTCCGPVMKRPGRRRARKGWCRSPRA